MVPVFWGGLQACGGRWCCRSSLRAWRRRRV